MSGAPPSAPNADASRSVEWTARLVSAAVLGGVSIAGLLLGGLLFWAVLAAVAIAALIEWHRLVEGGRFARETVITSLSVLGVIWAMQRPDGIVVALLAVVGGMAAAAASAAARSRPVFWPVPWHAFATLYIGLPVLALVALRDGTRGAVIIGGLFVAVWSADTGALLCGRMIGGPKLAPVLSPNKTWAGFLGGTLAAGAAEAVYAAVLDGRVLEGLAFGIFLALAGHCGDLFESWVKRRFHAKNTGHLIPGHGGMLDRIDSILFAAPLCAVSVYFLGFNPFAQGGS